MTQSGWIIMTVSVGGVTLLLLWCIFKVFTTREGTEDLHGLEKEIPDE
jgi:hypothetical protein